MLPPPIASPGTLVDLLLQRSERQKDLPLYTFLDDTDSPDEPVLTCHGLDVRARQIAAALQESSAPGERAVLLYPPGLEYVAGFFGCLYAGVVAVPAYPPDPARLERTLPRLRAIIQNAQATVVLTTSFIASMGESLFEQAPDLEALRWVATDTLPEGLEAQWRRPQVHAESLAFLQYTSGSTGSPKGVMLQHAHLLHNLECIARSFQSREDSVGVIWLPPYHDMGLIGGLLQPLYRGFPVALLSPLTFLRRPRRWLEALTRFGGTISGGPNFAFDLCVRKVPEPERQGLDLSRWEVAFCGAEPIRPETLERFTQAFSPCGFRPQAYYACYGLAEGTLIASGGRKGAGPVLHTVEAQALEQHRAVAAPAGAPGSRTLVSCGQAMPEQELAVVHPEHLTHCPPGSVGEVWLRGPSIAQGYWQRPEESALTFGAHTAEGHGPWLRTGDLGFLSESGELFITGRRKDLIILRGRNHYPQDLELTAEQCHPAMRPGCSAAFSVEVQGEERLVVVLEVDARKLESVEAATGAMLQRLAEQHEVRPHALVLIEPGGLPKTSSGKVQRRATREAWLEGSLRVVGAWQQASGPAQGEALPAEALSLEAPEATARLEGGEALEALEAWLAARVSARLRLRPQELDRAAPLTRYGLDSLAAVELAHELERSLGLALPVEALLQGPSTAELALRLQALRSQPNASAHAPIPRRAPGHEAPLSFAQQRMWFLEQLEPGTARNHIATAVRLEGPLHVSALERSLQEVVRRHSPLRTTFHSVDGSPVQRLHPQGALTPPLSQSEWGLGEAELQQWLAKEARRPFDLEQGPLLRTSLLRLHEHSHVLCLVIHHLVADGASMGVLAREVSALYAAFSSGLPSPLPPLALEYADYAAWQHLSSPQEALHSQLEWWKQQLQGAPAALELPTDRPRPAVQSHHGALLPVRLPLALSEQLEALCRQEGATPFMGLLAALQVLLSRYSGQSELCVGSPVAGRSRPELEGLIGPFINTLVLRACLSPQLSFRELLAQVRQTTLGALAHSELPFERLVEALQPARNLGRSPLFQVLLAFQQDVQPTLQLPGLSTRVLDIDTGTALFELSLSVARTAEGLTGSLIYDTALFAEDTARRLLGHLQVLLEAAVAHPELPLSCLPLLTQPERRQVLVDFNATAAPFPSEACLHQLVRQQAALRPEAIAVECGEERLTYRQLLERSSQLAWHLQSVGVGPDTLVAVCLERSVELVVSLLATLEAGGAYLPLEASYPRERLATMLEEARPQVLLTTKALEAQLPNTSLLRLHVDTLEPQALPTSAPSSRVSSRNLAYVIYTSGSTGRPKGVAVEHRSVMRLLHGARYARLEAEETFLLIAPVSFDASILELWGPLVYGARLVLFPTGQSASDLRLLAEVLERHQVTTLHLTSGLFSQMVDQELGGLRGLRQLLTGGDVVSAAHVRRALEQLRIPVTACYGPTESTLFTSCHRMVEPEQVGATVPIGTPIANTQVYLLSEGLEPVPVGVPGELYIGGEGLARGYLGRPDLTAERFIPNPFATSPEGTAAGSRLYRTGDLARWRADGVLEFLGRRDNQVKVRGFRIELAEVEGALCRHAAVREAVVVLREGAPGDKRLVAYVVPQPGPVPTPAELRGHLQSSLPEYMVPSAFLTLEELPLTANGKVDARALPAPEGLGVAAAAYAAPRTPTEERLASLFAEVLGLPRVGVHDDFFALGGHSLLATRLVSRVRSALGVELPLRSLFAAPSVAALAEHLPTTARSTAQPLAPQPRGGPLPLSFAQQRLWFLEQLTPGTATYNMPAAVRMEGPLHLEALERSFAELVRRHESLRTTFHEASGQPLQRIHPAEALTLLLPQRGQLVDLSVVPAPQREAEVLRLAQQEALRPFELQRGPLLRTCLLRLGEREHVLLLTMHHIVSDGWSMGVLVRELAALYEAFSLGRPSPLSELPVQYADYALWQRHQGEVLEQQLEWWKQQLAGAPPALELPTDRPRPPLQSHRGATLPVRLPRSLSESLEALCQREGVTPFMALLACYQLLLSRYSGQEDVSVGAPIAGRTQAELEGLIGFFANTLVLRSRLSPSLSFRELLAQVRHTTLEAYAHQQLPFERLVEALRPERDLARAPLFQAMLSLQSDPLPRLELPGLALQPLELQGHTSRFDLTLLLERTEQGYAGALEYATDLFERSTVERMMGHLHVLLQAAVADPSRRLRELPLLSQGERHQLLVEWSGVEWSDTGRSLAEDSSLHHLFEAQVDRTPEATALLWREQRLSYRELEQRSNRLAWHLLSLGVGPEVPVAVCLERTPELLVSLLAILKAGGAYVPLDPAWPRERLAFMLEDSGAHVVVTQQPLAAGLPAASAARPVLVEGSAWLEGSVQRPPPSAHAGHLAYVLFTSGSTGRPKGVCLQHRNAVAFLRWALDTFPPEQLAGTLAATSVCFDLSVFELFAPLSCGGAVVLADNALALPTLPARQSVTLVNTVPSAMAELVRQQAVPPSVRTVNLAGEALPATLVEALYRLPHVERVYNLYGPTEDTTYSTWALVPRQLQGAPSIGRPLRGTRAYVLDPAMQPVPMGVPGELYLAGAGLARGYWQRPALTAERFVPDPFAQGTGGSEGARLYRTGDRVRWRGDGQLEYLGRLDFQVKLRGFRIELGEVEEALRSLSAVREAAVLVREDTPGDMRLVAYAVARQGHTLESAALRSALEQRLPAYMVPNAFVTLEALPLTPTGKLDRKALPAPSTTGAATRHAAPRTPVEQQLAALWCQVLGVEHVGLEDHFFNLGGHSLLATQLISRVREAFNVELPLRALFDSPTLAGLAERLEAALQAHPPVAPSLQPVPRQGPPPLSFAQQRLWTIDQLRPRSAEYNMPVALRMEGTLQVGVLERCLEEVVRRHESLRTVLRTQPEGLVQVILPEASLPLAVVDLSSLPEAEREPQASHLGEQEALQPFDLAQGPLLRVKLLRLGEHVHVLLLTMHHVVSDGWSLGVLVREVAALYEAFSAGRPSPLPELPVQYADYALWQRAWLQGEALERQVSYWRQQLKGAPPLLELPTDSPRPAVQTFRGASVSTTLPPSTWQALQALCHREGATPFMALLACCQLLLSRYSGQRDVSVGTPIAGRTHAGLEGLIGFFVNTLVLRTRLSEDSSFLALLARVREVTLGAYAHQDVPFERLVDELSPPRSLGHSPLFQVMFALQNTPMPRLELPGLRLRPLPVEVRTTRFDLTFNVTERPEGLSAELEYNTDLYERPSAERMLTHLQALLAAAVADPARRLCELSMLSEAERRQLLLDWGSTPQRLSPPACIYHLFEAQVARTPEAPALSFQGATLTYRQLDTHANQLAHHLRRLGVGPSSCVATLLERGLEQVVSQLAILKAGGAFLSLDPSHPAERLAYMLQDSGARVLLSSQALLERLPPVSLQHVLDLGALAGSLAAEPGVAPAAGAGLDELAYVIYTSGSTGRPKGTLLTHRGLANTARAMALFVRPQPQERVLQFATPAFDASVFETFTTLLSGACLVLAPREQLQPGEPLRELLLRERIAIGFFTSSVLALLEPQGLEGMRAIVCGGEACTPEVARRWGPGRTFINAYGPTEIAVCATCTPSVSPERISIGQPLTGVQAYVLDEHLRPVPQGVAGELFIGGEGVGRGYLNQPELTAERFLPHPFTSTPGERLYRTGDRARWLPSGELEFLGRLDFQVKLRGFRVELGETEAALFAQPSVKDAVAVVREDVPGDMRLVAYVVLREGHTPDTAALRAALRRRLPEYMVPAAFVYLPALPLNTSDKVDRKALPPPDAASTGRQSRFVEPGTPLEQQLVALWSRELGVERIGVHDHFFEELGGNSLSVVRVAQRMREELQLEVPITWLFEHPTIRELARRLAQASAPAPTPKGPSAQERAQGRNQLLLRLGKKGSGSNG